MTKTVSFTINIPRAHEMLQLAGFKSDEIQNATDDEIFEKVLSMTECYGAAFTVQKEEI